MGCVGVSAAAELFDACDAADVAALAAPAAADAPDDPDAPPDEAPEVPEVPDDPVELRPAAPELDAPPLVAPPDEVEPPLVEAPPDDEPPDELDPPVAPAALAAEEAAAVRSSVDPPESCFTTGTAPRRSSAIRRNKARASCACSTSVRPASTTRRWMFTAAPIAATSTVAIVNVSTTSRRVKA